MTELPPLTHTLPMPAIDGVTIAHKGLNYLRPEILLDFISVTNDKLISVTPLAILYSTVGVLQHINLRKLPVNVAGRVVYPISSLSLPSLRAKLIVNEQLKKVKFQENLVTISPAEAPKGMKVIGLALEFTVQTAAHE